LLLSGKQTGPTQVDLLRDETAGEHRILFVSTTPAQVRPISPSAPSLFGPPPCSHHLPRVPTAWLLGSVGRIQSTGGTLRDVRMSRVYILCTGIWTCPSTSWVSPACSPWTSNPKPGLCSQEVLKNISGGPCLPSTPRSPTGI
jgi:hypothetical protein